MSLLGKKLLKMLHKPEKRAKNQEIPSFESAKNIGIIYTYGEKKSESADSIIELIEADSKQVDVLCFIDKKDITESKHPFFKIDQLSSWGKINSPEVESFLATSFDFLIHLDFELNEIMRTMLINTKAKCRVGFHSQQAADYYELMIGMNKSAGTSNFAEQTVKYIKAIR
ncbi:hypothetical protein [Roseivirga sp.]|jgi:hypothetical protein|uniref:DUF6913 domain-containing protein n=1 Tax=Roseivirga sp. TaxID=1964215 RepID=UPI000D7A7F7A|nr:hypothetical protein [Roseivirga sp.]PWL27204.1 MAG: hypothetical protein DCO95_17810 [Roseivirga sp. XM-24bin3]MBO6495185.1 hypothetical protein [Roseivirga sp.]MBO6660533.1 hypothetical protein [Roseivirga sp.]MBO6760876.1 hypothetical protein [Roseivirga sp.]MBO6906730.1 hypothetical protein [Roseivirga sp.]